MVVEFDQHFLENKDKLNSIIDAAEINSDDTVYEIGIGQGVLSRGVLDKKPKRLISIEKDDRLMPYIQNIERLYDNFFYEIGDGIEALTRYEVDKIVANIPYSITEGLYKKIIELDIPFCVFLQGKRFYDLILDERSRWSFIVNAFYNVEMITKVPGDCFLPPAKVMSVVVKLVKKENVTVFEKLIRSLFIKRSRSVKNAIVFSLVDILEISKKDAREIFDSLKIDDIGVFETMSNEKYVQLMNKLKLFVKKNI